MGSKRTCYTPTRLDHVSAGSGSTLQFWWRRKGGNEEKLDHGTAQLVCEQLCYLLSDFCLFPPWSRSFPPILQDGFPGR